MPFCATDCVSGNRELVNLSVNLKNRSIVYYCKRNTFRWCITMQYVLFKTYLDWCQKLIWLNEHIQIRVQYLARLIQYNYYAHELLYLSHICHKNNIISMEMWTLAVYHHLKGNRKTVCRYWKYVCLYFTIHESS